jgi:hypothetical protein
MGDVDGDVGAVETDVRLVKLSQEPDREGALSEVGLELEGEVEVVVAVSVLEIDEAVQAAQRTECPRLDR